MQEYFLIKSSIPSCVIFKSLFVSNGKPNIKSTSALNPYLCNISTAFITSFAVCCLFIFFNILSLKLCAPIVILVLDVLFFNISQKSSDTYSGLISDGKLPKKTLPLPLTNLFTVYTNSEIFF